MKKLIYVAAIPTGLVALSVLLAALNVINHIPLMKEGFELIGFVVVLQYVWNNKDAETREETVSELKSKLSAVLTDEEVKGAVELLTKGVEMLKKFYTVQFKGDDYQITSGPYSTQQEAEQAEQKDEVAVHLTHEQVKAKTKTE